jgi:hypothetical protein
MGFWEMAFGRDNRSRRRNIRIKDSRNVAHRRSGKFRIDPVESRFLLSADILEAAALTMSTLDDSALLSDQGNVLDVAWNAASGEYLLADGESIHRVDASTEARVGSFDIPGTDSTGTLGIQILDTAIPSLNGQTVDTGSLLVINGGESPDRIYALDPSNGEQLAVLDMTDEVDASAGVFHSGTGTIFLLDSIHDEIVEVDPTDGSTLARFSAPFAVGEGGLAIHPTTGTLWVGSSESDFLGEVTTDGELLRLVDFQAFGVDSDVSGLAFKNAHELLVSTTSGDVYSVPDPLVNMPTNITGAAGTTVTIPINIDNALGLESIDIGNFIGGLPGITYDTTILDATNLSIRAGTVLPALSTIVANVNDTAGTMYIAVALNPSVPITVFNGSLLLIDFQIKAGAADGTTKIDLRNVSLNEGGLILTQVPRPGDDVTDGAIIVGSGAPAPTLSVNDVNVAEGDSGTTNLTFTITRSGSTTGASSVQVQTANGTAASGSDYVAQSLTTVNFGAGDTTKTVAITINGDATFENNETLFLNLSNPTNATITDNQGVGTINNDDFAPTFSINDVQVDEGNSGTSSMTFTVTKTGATELASSVQVHSANNSAVAGSDYVALDLTTLNFAALDVTKTVVVTINGDATFEGNETFFVRLINPSGATISGGQSIATINNDDFAPTLSIDDVQIAEGNSGTSIATFTITKTGATELNSSVRVSTGNGTATAGSDYVAVFPFAFVDFGAGDLTKTFSVTINGDATFEGNETFFLNLGDAVLASIADGQGIGTITNDDSAPTFSIDNVQVAEGQSGTSTATFTVTKTGATELASSVDAQTADATAISNSDYVAAGPTTLNFAAGDLTKTFVVTINGDAVVEPDETFFVSLSNPTNVDHGQPGCRHDHQR